MDARIGIFLEPLNSNDRLFFSYIPNLHLARKAYCSNIFVDVTEVVDARCTNQLETANKQHIKE